MSTKRFSKIAQTVAKVAKILGNVSKEVVTAKVVIGKVISPSELQLHHPVDAALIGCHC